MHSPVICEHCHCDINVAHESKAHRRQRRWAIWMLVVLGTFWVIGWATQEDHTTATPRADRELAPQQLAVTPPMHALVTFTGTQFVVTNTGTEAWHDAELTINPSGLFLRGYRCQVGTLAPKATFSVGTAQCVNSESTRLDTARVKPTSVRIVANIKGQAAAVLAQF